jgi:hypothetical protein
VGEQSWIECNFVFSDVAVGGLRLVLHSHGAGPWVAIPFSVNSERAAMGRENSTTIHDPAHPLAELEPVFKRMKA